MDAAKGRRRPVGQRGGILDYAGIDQMAIPSRHI